MDEELYFKNRQKAGKLLAKKLEAEKDDFVVVGLPRGGIVVAKEVAKALKAPLDYLVIKKIGHPMNPEYAIGAISENGTLELNKTEVDSVDRDWLAQTTVDKRGEALAQSDIYRKSCPHQDLSNKNVIVVDDGLATGLSMFVAIEDIKAKNPRTIIVAVPVAPFEQSKQLEERVDKFVALTIPELFLGSVGTYYDEFDQVSEDEVAKLLKC